MELPIEKVDDVNYTIVASRNLMCCSLMLEAGLGGGRVKLHETPTQS
jgi:hypothetical protein